MKLKVSVAVLSAMIVAGAAWAEEAQVAVVRKPDTSQSNPYYPGNRPPLLPSPFIRLPTGTVKPQGWVRRQLELEAEGYIGHMGEVSGFLNKTDNAWLKADGKGGCFWEEVPYWLRGYTSMAFGEARTVSRARTYWWTEHYEHGGVRVPASWQLFYRDGDAWKPVPNPSAYGVATNQYNEVTFDPVKTTELKIEIQFQPGRCGSLIRWRVE